MTPAMTGPVWMPMRACSFQLRRFGDGGYRLEHARRERGNAVGVVGLSFGNSGRDHVGVADGLDLFHSVFRGQAVECGKNPAEKVDGTAGRQFRAERR